VGYYKQRRKNSTNEGIADNSSPVNRGGKRKNGTGTVRIKLQQNCVKVVIKKEPFATCLPKVHRNGKGDLGGKMEKKGREQEIKEKTPTNRKEAHQ